MALFHRGLKFKQPTSTVPILMQMPRFIGKSLFISGQVPWHLIINVTYLHSSIEVFYPARINV